MNSLSYRAVIDLSGQLKQIDQFADLLQDKIDYDAAHDPDILKGIRIVEDFLRRKHRVCYGGSAMNAHLPKKYKFYDPDKSIPDYDFFSPDVEGDVDDLVKALKAEGFTEVDSRPGIHAGTMKVFLNYFGIADISAIPEDLYNIFEARAKVIKGISFMDIDSLRMMMYLEISRPHGDVERWHKVYERILLLQYVAKPKHCKVINDIKDIEISKEDFDSIFAYGLNNSRVFAGNSILDLYAASKKKFQDGSSLEKTRLPIIMYSPSLEMDAGSIKSLLGDHVTIEHHEEIGETVPPLTVVSKNKRPVLLLVEETACHAYNTINYKNRVIRIASLDTLITLYFSLELANNDMVRRFFPMRINCEAQAAIDISNYLRTHVARSQFPFIATECSGHQKSKQTLLREKFARAAAEKKKRTTTRTKKSRSKSKSKTKRRSH
jgi:hypothetical protein